MTINDRDFGPMQFDGSEWILESRVVFNGTEIPIQIEPEEHASESASGISLLQRAALRFALSLSLDVLEASAPAVVQNYEVYREMMGDEEMPPLQKPVDVWQQVEPGYISIPPHGEVTTPTFLLFAECDWDPEHGLMVRFRDGIADASAQQSELGIKD